MFLLTAAPTPPPDNSVVAGPIGALVFVLLILATAFLCWNFTKQLRKTQKAKEQGVFGDAPEAASDEAGEAERHDAGTS